MTTDILIALSGCDSDDKLTSSSSTTEHSSETSMDIRGANRISRRGGKTSSTAANFKIPAATAWAGEGRIESRRSKPARQKAILHQLSDVVMLVSAGGMRIMTTVIPFPQHTGCHIHQLAVRFGLAPAPRAHCLAQAFGQQLHTEPAGWTG